MRRDPATSQKLTRGAVHLMNREIRAPKGEISPFPQASWRRNHDMAQVRAPKYAALRWTCPVSIIINAPRKSRLHFKRCVSPKSASPQTGQTSRLPHGSRVFKAVPAFSKRNLRPVSCFCKSVQQYTDANRQPTTPGQKRTRDRLKAIGEV